MEKALGQYLIYRSILIRRDADRDLFMAVPNNIAKLFQDPLGQMIMEDYDLRIVIFHPKKKEIVQWLP